MKADLLRVGMSLAPPLVIIGNNGKLEGILMDLMDYIAKSMNFRYVTRSPSFGRAGTMLKNGSWTGLMGQLQRNETDIILGPLPLNAMKLKFMDYTSCVTASYVITVLNWPHGEKKPFAFVDFFEMTVWQTIVWSFALCQVLAILFQWKGFENFWSTIRKANTFFFGALVDQSVSINTRRHSMRLLMIVWSIACLILTNLFTSRLVSSYSTIFSPTLIDTLEELLTFRGQILIGKGVPPYYLVMESLEENEIFGKLQKKLAMESTIVPPPLLLEDITLQDVARGKAAIMMPGLPFYSQCERLFRNKQPCRFRVVKENVERAFGHIGIAKDLEKDFRKRLQMRTLRYLANGFYQHSESKYLRYYKNCLKSPYILEDTRPIELADLLGIFVVHFGGCCVSVVAVIVEICFSAISRRIQARTPTRKLRFRKQKLRFHGKSPVVEST